MSMKKEMGTVKSALGPWFHRTRTRTLSAGRLTRSGRRRSRTEGDARLGDELVGNVETLESGHDGSRTEDSLARYLPAFGEFMPPQYAAHPSGMGLSALNGAHAQIHVAPLDLETSLVGALEGLRESVVGVAAGIDLLGRRSEIALAQETLRLSEEVISLRAGVHGLRMQVSRTPTTATTLIRHRFTGS